MKKYLCEVTIFDEIEARNEEDAKQILLDRLPDYEYGECELKEVKCKELKEA